jgi:APA family basic amino acid/polyamine antiporter
LALGLALSGSFAILAVASAIARLVTYISVSTAAIRVRHRTFGGAARPALFVVSMGTLGPVLAIAVSLLMLAGATFRQLFGGALALIIGAVLFVANKRVAASKIAHRDD